MYINDLIEKLQAISEKHGNIKTHIFADECESLLRIETVSIDAFCPRCGTLYCEIAAESAPESYWLDNECCS